MRSTLFLTAALAAVVLAGCSSAPAGGPLFDNENYATVSCMKHQTDKPGARYTDTTTFNTGEIFTLMKYYTAYGTKPYCDGAPASDLDRQWAQIYVGLTGPAAKVSTALGGTQPPR